MVRRTHHHGYGIPMAGTVDKWFLDILKEKWSEKIQATKKTWKSPTARYLMVKGAIAEGWINKDDPRVKKMLEKQMKGRRRKNSIFP